MLCPLGCLTGVSSWPWVHGSCIRSSGWSSAEQQLHAIPSKPAHTHRPLVGTKAAAITSNSIDSAFINCLFLSKPVYSHLFHLLPLHMSHVQLQVSSRCQWDTFSKHCHVPSHTQSQHASGHDSLAAYADWQCSLAVGNVADVLYALMPITWQLHVSHVQNSY